MKTLIALFASLLLAASASAEIKSIDIKIFGMDWEVCAHAVRVSLKSVSGVDSVDVGLANGLASVKMKTNNTTTLKQLQSAITKNGFTMKDSRATVEGSVEVMNGAAQLRISGSNELLPLVPESQTSGDAGAFTGKLVLIEGTIPETTKGKQDSIRYQSIKEEKWI